MRRPLLGLLSSGSLALGLVAVPARADPSKAECADANTNGQTLRMSEKFAAARQSLQICQNPSCPRLVRVDCVQHMDELERVQPTIVFDVKDSSGSDVTTAKVTMDGAPFSDRLQGGALRVDPGDHTFTFSADGHSDTTVKVVIKEGEKNRSEHVILGAIASTVPLPVTPPPPPPPAPSHMATQRVVGIVVGVEGLVGLGAGGALGALSLSYASKQKTDCASASSCSNHAAAISDHNSATSYGTAATIGFAGGGALLAAGVILLLTGPRSTTEQQGLLLAPSVGPTGGGVVVGGAF